MDSIDPGRARGDRSGRRRTTKSTGVYSPPEARSTVRARVHIIAAVAAAATLSAALPRPAQAQFWPPFADKDKKGRFHVGPLALTPRLELRNAGVDTNVFVTPSDPTRDTAIVLRASTDA